MSAAEEARAARSARAQLSWFLGGSGSWAVGMGMQGVLFSWTFVGVLGASADAFGTAQMTVALPGLVLMLIGGATADRTDGRALLLRLHLLAALPPSFLAVIAYSGLLNPFTLIIYALGLRVLSSFSMPARDGLLSNIAGRNLQRTITLMSATQSGSTLLGTYIAGHIETVGIETIALLQGGIVLAGTYTVAKLAPAIINRPPRPETPLKSVLGGFTATWQLEPVRQIIAINFFTGFINMGTFMVAFPLIVRDIYDGTGQIYAYMMMLWQAGNLCGSFILYRFMPITRPGRLMLCMSLARGSVILLVMLSPPFWLFLPITFAWGMTMGMSGSMSRSIVQETAPESHRARVLSVFRLSIMGAAPVGAFLIGAAIHNLGLLNALVFGPIAALLSFTYAITRTGIWRFQSTAHLGGPGMRPAAIDDGGRM